MTIDLANYVTRTREQHPVQSNLSLEDDDQLDDSDSMDSVKMSEIGDTFTYESAEIPLHIVRSVHGSVREPKPKRLDPIACLNPYLWTVKQSPVTSSNTSPTPTFTNSEIV